MKDKIVVVWSGGLDSTTLIAHHLLRFLEGDIEIHPIFINRGQGALVRERESIKFYTKLFKKLFPNDFHDPIEYEMLSPRGQHEKATGEKDVAKTLALRNADLVNYGIRHALCIGAKYVAVGSCVEDTYGDGSAQFWGGYEDVVKPAYGVTVYADFHERGWSKVEMIQWAYDENIPLEHTWSCYKNGKKHCGVCKSCIRRKNAFARAGVEDKTKYAK